MLPGVPGPTEHQGIQLQQQGLSCAGIAALWLDLGTHESNLSPGSALLLGHRLGLLPLLGMARGNPHCGVLHDVVAIVPALFASLLPFRISRSVHPAIPLNSPWDAGPLQVAGPSCPRAFGRGGHASTATKASESAGGRFKLALRDESLPSAGKTCDGLTPFVVSKAAGYARLGAESCQLAHSMAEYGTATVCALSLVKDFAFWAIDWRRVPPWHHLNRGEPTRWPSTVNAKVGPCQMDKHGYHGNYRFYDIHRILARSPLADSSAPSNAAIQPDSRKACS
eukprot:scaffold1638_cov258-Pinguiococcus_pyrenoidosus.AAC.4